MLYEDPKLGFQILAHINDKARVSPPHDHGASWAIYGQATHYTDMIEWEREDDGTIPDKAKLKPVKKYRLMPGHAGIYQDGTIHSIDYPDYAALHPRDRHQPRQHPARALRPGDRQGAPDDAAAGDVSRARRSGRRQMPSVAAPRPVHAHALKAMLADGEELALIDLREELIFSQSHLLFARSVPLSRLELKFARLVPRRGTRIVLCDDGDGLAERAAEILSRAGYTNSSYLDGGVAAWAAAGFELFSGVNVPSKAFGEFVEHDSGTPSIDADELDRLIRAGTDMVVLDSRPFDEYQRVSIPTAINVPGAELVLRIRDLAPSPDTLVVVNCAGRTRSIIGAQSLINAGVPNKVVALRNGTMGWNLAGLACDSGKDEARAATSRATAWPGPSPPPSAWRTRFGIARIDRATLERWRADERRTHALSLRRARSARNTTPAMLPGAVSAPGGQLVQATDQYVGTLGARIVLVDDAEVRAVMTASWLRQMGWKDVFVLVETGHETGAPATPVLGSTPPPELRIDCAGARRAPGAQRSDRRRSLAQPRLSQGAHSRRLVRDPLAARAGARRRFRCAARWC